MHDIVAKTSSVLPEMAGVVKWFDASKGCGFIVPDGGGKDVLLHITALRRGGYESAREGARVVFEPIEKPQGLRVSRVLSMDESVLVVPASLPPKRQTVESGEFEPATCKWFKHKQGFGFLTRGQGTPDIFVHIDTLKHCGIVGLEEGQRVLVRFGRGDKGLIATEVKLGTQQ